MISLIVAQAKNRAIGKDNDFPWHLPDELKRFKAVTIGHAVIMGRNTFEHIVKRLGKPLPERTNIVITRNLDYSAAGVLIAHSVEEALKLANESQDEVFIIGGEQLYASTLPLSDRIYLTEIDLEFEGDAFFPELNRAQWRETSREHHAKDEKHAYSFDWVILDKK